MEAAGWQTGRLREVRFCRLRRLVNLRELGRRARDADLTPVLETYADAVTKVRDLGVALSDRRAVKVLKLVAEGHSSKEIAEMLFISIKTVHRHRENLLHKLGLRDRLELTRYAIRVGLIEP